MLNVLAEEIGIKAYCASDFDANTGARNFFNVLFNLSKFAGVLFILYGAITLGRQFTAGMSGDQGQPGALGKGFGFLILGFLLVSAKMLLVNVFGFNPDTFTIF